MQTRDTNRLFRAKIKYFFKVQVVPVSTDMLCNEDGKSKIRARERILYSPIRPIVTDPLSDIILNINKSVGLSGKASNCEITVNKSFFVAGETAFMRVRIDNSDCANACSLVVTHTH